MNTLAQRLKLLRELVEINSGTSNVAGVNAVQTRVSKELKKMGWKPKLLTHPKDAKKVGKLLVAEQRGKQRGMITLVTHADTVFEKNHPFQKFRFSKDKSWAFGPGVIDDKGGILVALEGLARFQKKYGNALSFRFLCSPSEEVGSPGWHTQFQRFSKDSTLLLGFEPSLDNGSLIGSRSGGRWYDIAIQGKEAHAGRGHRDGVNAGHDLAIKCDQLQRLTNYEEDVTVSIGSLEGGTGKFNVVCGHARAKVDARFPDFEKRDVLHKKIDSILKTAYVHSHTTQEATQTSYTLADDCPPVPAMSESQDLLKRYTQIVSSLEGEKVGWEKSCGSADVNYMSRAGLPILDGLGPSGCGMHTKDEGLRVSSLETRAEALALFLASLLS